MARIITETTTARPITKTGTEINPTQEATADLTEVITQIATIAFTKNFLY